MKVYKFMLTELSDQDKFSVAGKISGDIIGSTVDGILPWNRESKELIRDSLNVLACEEIKLSIHRNHNPQEDMDEMEPVQAAVEVLKNKAVTQVRLLFDSFTVESFR